jgi:hypothetical protein
MTDDPRKLPEGWPDDEPPPTEEELTESARLREELEDPGSRHRDVELMRAMRMAANPKPIDQIAHKKMLDRVVPRPRAVWYPIGLALTAAAAVALLTINLRPSMAPAPEANLLRARTTSNMFDAPFPKEGDTSKRVDAIALARARDLRSNKWTKWGVK